MTSPHPQRPDPRVVERVFDQWAAEGRGDRMEVGHRATAGRVLTRLPIRPGETFLDLGAGNGWAAREAAGRGARVVAVDVSWGMLRLAASKPAIGRLDWMRATFERLPFRDGAFDRAWGMEAIYYAHDLDRALAEVARVVAPDGRLHLVLDHYRENVESHAWPEKVGVGMHLLGEDEWRDAVERAGFPGAHAERVHAPRGLGDSWHATHGSLLVEGTRG